MTVRPAFARLALAPALALALATAAAHTTPTAAAPSAPAAPPIAPAPPAAQPDPAPRASLLVTVAGESVWQQFAARLADADGSPASAADVRARAATMHDELLAARAAVLAAQAPAVAAAEATGAQVISRYTTLANGFLLHATADQVARLATVPGILAIEPAPLVTPQLDGSVPFIGGPALATQKGYDGTGSYTAVIDTGVDYTHAHLGGPGTEAAYAAASAVTDTQRIDDLWEGQPLFPTAKVVAGYDFVGRRYNPPHLCSAAQEAAGTCTSTPIPDPDPLDGGGHGTHVSGIVAGNAFAGGLSNGVAPGAKLVGLKIYGEDGDDEAADVLVDAIEWCGNVNLGIETRGTVPPRVDAVNISLGEDWAVASTLFDTTAAAATAAGVTVVASAGNSGNRAFIVGTPSASPPVVSVASTVPPESGMEIVTTNGITSTTHVGLESAIARPFKDVIAGGRMEGQLAWFGRGCGEDPQPQDVSERVALVERGLCNLSDKILKAQGKGAIAVLMFTNENPKSQMAGDAAGITIPAAMIDRAPGETLRDMLLGGAVMHVTFDASKVSLDLSSADLVAGYSSRGPNIHGALKPDIAAPGSNILSAAMGTGTRGASFNGTSMAGPHVAGAAGVVAQRNRAENLSLDGLGVAALLMNYAQPTVYAGGGIVPIPRQGAGRLDVLRAGTGPLLARAGTIASLNVGIRALTAPVNVTLPVTLTNLTDAPVTYRIVPRFRRPAAADAGLTFQLQESVVHSLAPRETRTAPISVAIDPAKLADWTLYPAATGDGIGSVEASEIDGWLTFQPVDGNAQPLPDVTAPAAAVPFYLMARRASAVAHTWMADPDAGPGHRLTFDNTSPFTGTVQLFHRPAQRTPGLGTPGGSVVTPAGAVDAMPTDPDEPNVPDALDVAAVGVRATTASTTSTTADRLDFAVVTHAAVMMPVPQQTQIFIDTDRDGSADWRVRAGDHRGPDRVQTFVGRWVASSNAITGTERTTDTLFSSDVATHASVLSVPMTLLGLTEPAPFDFWVVRRGTHEDWSHIGLPDVVPDGADQPGGPRLTFDPTTQAVRLAAPATAVAGGRTGSIPLAIDAGRSGTSCRRHDGYLAIYPENDFAGNGQWAWIDGGGLRVVCGPVYLPQVLATFDAAVMGP